MNFVALKMLTGDRAKYLGLIFTLAVCTFLLARHKALGGCSVNPSRRLMARPPM